MSSRSRRRRRRPFRDEAPSAPYGAARRGLLWGSVCAVLGMIFLYAGTRFWASAPFVLPGLTLVLTHQILSWRGMSRGGGAVHPPAALIPGIALLVYVLVRAVFFSEVPYQTWTEAYQLGVALLLYVLFVDVGTLRHGWSQAKLFLYVAGALQGMLAVALHIKGSNMVLWLERPDSYGMRASGTWICPNHFAHFLQMASVVAVADFLTPKIRLHLRLVAGYALIWMVPALLLSQSRSGLLGLVAGVGILVAMKWFRKGWKGALAVFGAGVVTMGAGFLGLRFFFTGMYDRLQDTLGGNIRFSQFWPDTWRMIQGEGFWGVGPGVFKHTFEQYREAFSLSHIYLEYAHNEYLHVLADYGWVVVGLLSLGILWTTGFLLIKAFREPEDGKAMVPILLLALGWCTLLHAVFDFNLHIFANGLVFVMLLALLEGQGRQMGLWNTRPLPLWTQKPSCGLAAALAAGLIPACILLGLGGWAEYQVDVARKAGDEDAAAIHASEMRKWTPMHWRGWTEQGLVLRKKAFWMRDPGKKAELIAQSREAYRAALERNPYERIALAGLVELSKMEGDTERALEGLSRLEELAPYDVRIRIQKGLALEKLGKYREALEVFQEAKRMRRRRDEQIELNIRYLRGKIRSSER